MSASVRHDVVVGPSGPTRNNVVAKLIAADLEAATESWLIDVYRVHPTMADWNGINMNAARNMIARLNAFRPGSRGLCITIEDASVVLKDRQMRNNLEEALRGISTASIMFRLVVVSLDVSSFGGSTVIRDEVLAGNVIKAVSHG